MLQKKKLQYVRPLSMEENVAHNTYQCGMGISHVSLALQALLLHYRRMC